MKKLLLFFIILFSTACVDGNYSYPGGYGNNGYGYPDNRDCSYYGNCPGYGNRPYYPPQQRCGGNKRCGHDRCGGNKRCGGDKRCGGNRDTVINVPPPPPPSRPEIQPSCPSGSVLDGRGCRVTDPSKRRPGGDGYMNPCPSGMWYSGGRCVGK